MRRPLGQNDDGGFLRPHDAWQCGLLDQGQVCPSGPLPGGRCPGASACRPLRQADRWICNRSDLRGGACEEGPQLDGLCPHAYHCQPRPTLRSRRGRFVLAVFAVAVGMGAIGLSSRSRNDLLAPGPLSPSHAQLASRQASELRCGHCHAAGNASLGAWLAHTLEEETLHPPQTDLCLQCHRETIPPERALHAHHYPNIAASLAADVGQPRLRDPRTAIVCAACHREHQGVDHDLTHVSNDTCQACHAQRFESFADGHPEFDDWPTSRSGGIAFDHRTHQSKHYPSSKREFDCGDCHRSDEERAGQMTLGYQAACARCHDQAIQASLSGGVPLLALPMLDVDALVDAGVEVGSWPEQATGDFDGPTPLALRLLLAERENVEPARLALGPALDFFDVEFDNLEHLQAAGQFAAEIRLLLEELSRDGYAALGRRVERLTGRQATPALSRRLAGHLSAETIAAVRQGWFAADSSEAAAATPAPGAGVSAEPATTWRVDHATATLSYLPTGHADLFLQAWLELAIAAAGGPYEARVEPLLREFLEPTAPGLCTSCHQAVPDDQGRWQIHWQASTQVIRGRDFTHFAHGPHLLQPQLAECTSCHVVQTSGVDGAIEFQPIRRQACAACHTEHAAGDRCTQCHRYHVDHWGGGPAQQSELTP